MDGRISKQGDEPHIVFEPMTENFSPFKIQSKLDPVVNVALFKVFSTRKATVY